MVSIFDDVRAIEKRVKNGRVAEKYGEIGDRWDTAVKNAFIRVFHHFSNTHTERLVKNAFLQRFESTLG